MADALDLPSMPSDVAAAFASETAGWRKQAMQLRSLIFRVADETGTAPLTETLKWGEPAYLTKATRSGTTVRLGRVRGQEGLAVLVNCQTTLVAEFRDQFAGTFRFAGNRALLVEVAAPLPEAALAICLGRALTYHRAKRKRSA